MGEDEREPRRVTGTEPAFEAPAVVAPTVPAATTVLLRDADERVEVLMVRRNSRLEFAGGMWVFPGGRIDPIDYPDGRAVPEDPDAVLVAARRAAVREASEETGLDVDEASLVWFSHWTPPPVTPKRFATWFFAAPAPRDLSRLAADGGEIHDVGWFEPAEAMRRRNAGEIELAPPTWITLEQLQGHRDVDATLRHLTAAPPEHFTTRFARVEDGAVAMYHGDAGYADEDPTRDGPRHRLWMVADGWRYERSVTDRG
ncbi:MAG: NUDIX hydrolase [Acidimicrobiales bacterium]|jgi:8-oxo-dGTP pyrophosphatase MutT (NUDIX family)|nr:NUDIX hydrolase [Acidimicrobiales bacterium]